MMFFFFPPWCLGDWIVLNDSRRICEKKIHSKKNGKDPGGHEALARNATNGYENARMAPWIRRERLPEWILWTIQTTVDFKKKAGNLWCSSPRPLLTSHKKHVWGSLTFHPWSKERLPLTVGTKTPPKKFGALGHFEAHGRPFGMIPQSSTAWRCT